MRPGRILLRTFVALTVLAALAKRAAAATAGDQVIADFDTGAALAVPTPQNVVLAIAPDGDGGACGSVSAAPVGEPRTDLVAVRRRGAGTDLAPNA